MGIWSNLRGWLAPPPTRASNVAVIDGEVMDLPLSRRTAATEAMARVASVKREAYGATLPMYGLQQDQDLQGYRRLTTGTPSAKDVRRDLNPLQQDRMLEVCWWLWEQNPLARRIIQLTTDLVVGDGFQVVADDERFQGVIDEMFSHPNNHVLRQMRTLYNGLSLNGELILPVAVNPVTGSPVLGYVEPYMVEYVQYVQGNALMPDKVFLKGTAGVGSGVVKDPPLTVVRLNPDTGKLEGDCFYMKINSLPNSTRGRSDLLPMADWLDLYDTFLFAEAERVNLLSAFAWDLTVTGGDEKDIAKELAKLPSPTKAGQVYGHNEKIALEAKAPDLKGTDRAQVARVLLTHIAGAAGYPIAYFGDISANKATIEGQNDVTMKTPASRQRELVGFLGMIVDFAIQSTSGKNPSLFRGADQKYRIQVPEIAAKDVARIGPVIAQVAAGMDVALANGTTSKKVATVAMLTALRQLGIETSLDEVLAEIESDSQDAQAMRDKIQAEVARQRASGAGGMGDGVGKGGTPPGPAIETYVRKREYNELHDELGRFDFAPDRGTGEKKTANPARVTRRG